MLLAFLLACTVDPAETTGGLALDGDAAAGEAVYADSCADCHGADGEGGTGPAMTEKVPLMTDERIASRITEGYDSDQEGSMPAVALDDQAVADCVAWLREAFD